MIMQQGQSVPPMEAKIVRLDGQVVEVEGRGALIVYEGKPAIQIVLRDITERKQAEEEIRRLALAVATANDGIIITDLDGRITFTNEAEERILGYGPGEMIGMEVRSLHSESTRDIEPRRIIDATSSDRHWAGEVVLQRKAGEEFPARLSTSLMQNEHGRPIGMVGIITDLTERMQAEEAVRESEERFRTIFERSNDAIFVIDPERDEILDINSMACTMMGYSHYELTSIPLSAMYPKQMPQLQAFGQLVMEKGHGWTDELTCTTKSGRDVLTEISASVADIQGKRCMVCLVRDITERKQAEEMMRESSRLIALGELAAVTAHELNNPLTAVLGFAQLLEAQDLNPSVKEDVQQILTEAKRAADVVRNMLSLARKHEMEKVPLDVTKVVERVLAINRVDLKTGNVNVETDFASSCLYAIGDQHRLAEVFLNIVTNAQQAMSGVHRGGRLLIRGTRRDEFIRISITDNGPGIEPEHLQHIFDPFFTTKGADEGTGLGLSICQSMVQQQGGRIWVESEVGKGATVHVELPASESQ